MFLGAQALTTDDLNFFMLVAVVHFSVGAIAGAVFHVLVNRFVPDRPALQIGLGVALRAADVGRELLLRARRGCSRVWSARPTCSQLMPAWIAALTHVIYGLTLGLLQPLGRFVPVSAGERSRDDDARGSRGAASPRCIALLPSATRAGAGRRPARAKAREVYARYCAGCHGANGDGKGPRRRC